MGAGREGRWEAIRSVDLGGLQGFQRLAIITVSLGMFIWGIVLALAPLMTEWPFVPRSMDLYVLLAAPASLMLGNLVIGKASESRGRKSTFVLTLALYSIGIALIVASQNVTTLILGLALSEFGLGGEESAALSYLAEMMPISKREIVLVGSTNVANIGAAVAAAIFLAVPASVQLEKLMLGVTLAVAVVVMLVTRLMIPESYRWVAARESRPVGGELQEKLDSSGYALRLTLLTGIAITIVLTYALLALVLGPYLFPRLTSWIVLTYNLGESIGGLAAMALLARTGVKPYTLAAYLGGLLTMIAFIPWYFLAQASASLFLTLLFLNGVFGELGWGSRVILEPELFPTRNRSIGIASVRAAAYVLYIASLFFTASFTVVEYLLYNAGLWALGAAVSALWYFKGVETKGLTLEQINGRDPSLGRDL